MTMTIPTTAPSLLSFTMPTPAGRLAVLVTPQDDVVRAAGFCDPDELIPRLAPVLSGRGVQTSPPRGPVADAITAYGDGVLTALDGVQVEQPGGPFLQRAWQALRDVRAGATTSYTGLAAASGNQAAVRAAGSACARNLVAPFVPCHRVVRSDGSLGGYRYGLDVKEALLRHEGR